MVVNTAMGLTVSERTNQMLAAIKECGPGWHSRVHLAAQLDKIRLNPTEIMTLDLMAETGMIEKALQPTIEQPHVNQWVYRLK